MTDNEEITDENFEQYFFDTRKNKPVKGQVLARFATMAEFVDGQLKKDIISLILKDKVESAVKVMHKLGCATHFDSVRICREITEDLCKMSPEQVENKVYKYTYEKLYYAEKKNVPTTDPHWSVIGLDDFGSLYDSEANPIEIKLTLKENG